MDYVVKQNMDLIRLCRKAELSKTMATVWDVLICLDNDIMGSLTKTHAHTHKHTQHMEKMPCGISYLLLDLYSSGCLIGCLHCGQHLYFFLKAL